MTSTQPNQRNSGKVTWLALMVAGFFLVYALWDVDLANLGARLGGADLALLAPFLLVLVGYFLLKAHRWALILRPLVVTNLFEVSPALMVGFAGNNVLPAHLGELVRCLMLARRHQLPASAVLTTQVVERMFDVLAIVTLFALALPWVQTNVRSMALGATSVLIVLAFSGTAIWALSCRPTWVDRAWQWLRKPLPPSLQSLGERTLDNVSLALQGLRQPALLLRLAISSLLQWACMATLAWISLQAFEIPASATEAVTVVAVCAIAVTLPSAPGYVGTTQAAFVFALLPYGVTRDDAVAASIFYLAAQWLPVTLVGGVFFLWHQDRGGLLRAAHDLERPSANGPE